MPAKKRKLDDSESSTPNQVYHHSIRWSVEHSDEAKDNLIAFMKANSDKWVFQAELTINEEGKENPHYQGYIHTKKSIRSKTLAINNNEDFKGIEIRPASNAGKVALQGYCMKDETRVHGPWADRELYRGRDLWPESKLLPWQREILVKFKPIPDDRKMVWVYDPVGNNGKTKFIKYLCYKHEAIALGYGHATDLLNLVFKFQNRRIYAFNLVRSKPANLSELDLYASMESIKDGLFINTKFETGMVMMNPPHILVCSNHLPKYGQISADRWEVYVIREGKLFPQALA
jgi:hypothetical protein